METYLRLRKTYNLDIRTFEYQDLATITSLIKQFNEEEKARREESERKLKAKRKQAELKAKMSRKMNG